MKTAHRIMVSSRSCGFSLEDMNSSAKRMIHHAMTGFMKESLHG
jgi:hypothetical protein